MERIVITLFCFLQAFVSTYLFAQPQPLPRAEAPVLSIPEDDVLEASTRASLAEPAYDYPLGLSCLGIYNEETQPACNYLSCNRLTNGDHFLWAPLNRAINYTNRTSGFPTGYKWTLPGSNEGTSTETDGVATYSYLGHYPFPILEATDTQGATSTYQAEGEILVSGKAEISTANCRKWGETYQLGYLPLNQNAGYVGGTNSAGMEGFGNLFMTAHGQAHITGVNVYFAFKPTKYSEDAQLLLRVWYPTEDEQGNMILDGLPLEVVYLPVSEIREAYDNELAVKNAAVGEFRFEKPLQIWDKPLFFVTVEGFGNDPAENDIVMLTEVMGQTIPEDQMNMLLAHNSLVNYGGYGYTLPINYFGAMPGASFMICPIIDNQDGNAVGIEQEAAQAKSQVQVETSGLNLEVTTPQAADVRIFAANGMAVDSRTTEEGQTARFQLPASGFYIVQVVGADGQTDVHKIAARP